MIELRINKNRDSICECDIRMEGSAEDLVLEFIATGDSLARGINSVAEREKTEVCYDYVAMRLIDNIVKGAPQDSLLREKISPMDIVKQSLEELVKMLGAGHDEDAVVGPDPDTPLCDPIEPRTECVGCKNSSYCLQRMEASRG